MANTDSLPNSPIGSAVTHGSSLYLTRVCLVASLGGLLFGFDTAVISGTVERVTAQFGLSELLQGWFTGSALVGCIVGAAVAGWLGDKFGRRPIMIVAAVLFFASALYSTVPPTFNILIAARIVGGIGVGMASVLAPMYISEFAPSRIRGRLVALYQLSIVIGILVAYFSNWCLVAYAQGHPLAFGGEGTLHRILVSEVWRGMFGAEMLPAGLFFLLLFFVPESPRWLANAGRADQAFTILAAVSGGDTARRQLDEIQAAAAHEEGRLRELLRPGLRTALLVAVMLSVFGQLSGVNIVVYYGPKILMAAGYEDIAAMLGQVGFGLINLVFTVIALLVIDHLGRRPLLVGGMAAVTVTLAVIGGLFLFGGGDGVVSKTVGLWIGAMICLYMACIALSICAVIWVLTPEILPNRVRGRAMSIATFANWTTNMLSASLFPWFVESFGMHAGFFASSAICLVATVFFWAMVPETKGRSLEDIELHWTQQPSGGAV